MEVTKQKMRCAAAKDPSYPCKHHGEGQVSQLPGEEVTAACRGASSRPIAAGTDRGRSRTRGAGAGTPRAAADLAVARAGRPAGQCVWPGPRAQLPCHYVPAQSWLTEQKSGPRSAPAGNGVGGSWRDPLGAPSHACVYSYTTQHTSPPGGHAFPECHQHRGRLPGAHPALSRTHGPRGPPQPPREGFCSLGR